MLPNIFRFFSLALILFSLKAYPRDSDATYQGNQNDQPITSHPRVSELPPEQDTLFLSPEDIDQFLQQFSEKGILIVGGNEVDILEYPWQVSLQMRPEYGSVAFCGGVIIGQSWVLTAAHCLRFGSNTLGTNQIRIRAGFSSMKSGDGAYFDIGQVLVHPGYDSQTHENDIALLQLATPFETDNQATRPIPWVSRADVLAGLTDHGVVAQVSGWGTTQFQGYSSDHLKAVQVPLVDAHHSRYSTGQITPDMILAGETGSDACQGDSGGPLIVSDGLGGYKLAGIVSWGNGCGLEGYPGVYARVSHFEKWIEEYVGLNDPNKYAIHWAEDFEPALAGGELPEGWEVRRNTINDGGLSGENLQLADTSIPDHWFRISAVNYPYSQGNAQKYIHSGEAALHIHYAAPDFTWAVSPEILLPQGQNRLELAFWPWLNNHHENNWLTRFHVTALVDGNWQTLLSWTAGVDNRYFREESIPIDQLAGQNVRFGFVYQYNDGYELGLDDISVRYENPGFEASFRVRHGQELLSGAGIQISGATSLFTDGSGQATASLFRGPHPYNFVVSKKGYTPFAGSIQPGRSQEVIEVELEKLPAPEMIISPQAISMKVVQGQIVSLPLFVANTGNAGLSFNMNVSFSGGAAPAAQKQQPEYSLGGKNAGIMFLPGKQQLDDSFPAGSVELHHDNGPSAGIGTSDAASWIAAARFTENELEAYYDDFVIGGVGFHINSQEYNDIWVKVWEGGSAQGPADEVYSELVTEQVMVGNFTYHQLHQAIVPQMGQEYWVGYAIDATGGYPSTVDSGPMVADKGGWIYIDGSWKQLGQLQAALNYNWVIRAALYPANLFNWLWLEPGQAEVPAGEQVMVLATLDATQLPMGEYQALISIQNNAGPDVQIPVQLQVTDSLFDVRFTVRDLDGNPVEDAVVSLQDVVHAPGDYLFEDLPAGNYRYGVSHEYFREAAGGLILADQSLEVVITLIPQDEPIVLLNLHVEDEFQQPVAGAMFHMQDFGSFLTEEDGSCIIESVAGDYQYELSKTGMKTLQGNFRAEPAAGLQLTMEYLRYQLALSASPPDGGTVSGQGEYYHGQQLLVSARPEENYHFLHWTERDVIVSEDPEFELEMTAPLHLKAHFLQNTFTLTFSVSGKNKMPIEDATILLNQQTYEPGHYVFGQLMPGTYHYQVSREDFLSQAGSIYITNKDLTKEILLELDDLQGDEVEVKVFPVPASDHLNVETNSNILGIELFDLAGRKIWHHRPVSPSTLIHTGSILPGVYLLRIILPEKVVTRRIQKH